MRQSKQVISAIILAPVIVLLISVYSNVGHFGKFCVKRNPNR